MPSRYNLSDLKHVTLNMLHCLEFKSDQFGNCKRRLQIRPLAWIFNPYIVSEKVLNAVNSPQMIKLRRISLRSASKASGQRQKSAVNFFPFPFFLPYISGKRILLGFSQKKFRTTFDTRNGTLSTCK